ncbi:MAG: CopD family protein [Sinobacterium sp.]|nr:CopD family protein [Sinobacterium sp.]
MLFLWLKALHIIFIICWFAGIFYLPRLFVHYCMSEDEKTQQRLCIMMRKLYNFTTPFAVLSLVFGSWMIVNNVQYYQSAAWLHAKLSLVVLLFAYHFYNGKLVKVFEQGANTRSHKFYRYYNEAPVLAMFAIVILAVVKPF